MITDDDLREMGRLGDLRPGTWGSDCEYIRAAARAIPKLLAEIRRLRGRDDETAACANVAQEIAHKHDRGALGMERDRLPVEYAAHRRAMAEGARAVEAAIRARTESPNVEGAQAGAGCTADRSPRAAEQRGGHQAGDAQPAGAAAAAVDDPGRRDGGPGEAAAVARHDGGER